MLTEIDHPEYGTITVCRSPLNFTGAQQQTYRPSPRYAADNAAVYGGLLDLDDSEIESLRNAGVL
jgi:CoA:oxalate CoA-transferase